MCYLPKIHICQRCLYGILNWKKFETYVVALLTGVVFINIRVKARDEHVLFSGESKLKMPSRCCAVGCRSGYKSETTDQKRHFFTVPKDNAKKILWEEALLQGPLTASKMVCDLHFSPDDMTAYDNFTINGNTVRVQRSKWILNVGAIPKLNLRPKPLLCDTPGQKRPYMRRQAEGQYEYILQFREHWSQLSGQKGEPKMKRALNSGGEVEQLGMETVADNVSNSSCLALSKQSDLSGTDGLFQDPSIEEGGEVEHPCAEAVAVNITKSSCLESSKQTDLSGTDNSVGSGLFPADPNIEDGISLETGIQVDYFDNAALPSQSWKLVRGPFIQQRKQQLRSTLDDIHFYELCSETGESVYIRKAVHINLSSGEVTYTIGGHRCCVPPLPFTTKAEVEVLIKEYDKLSICDGVCKERFLSIEICANGFLENGIWRSKTCHRFVNDVKLKNKCADCRKLESSLEKKLKRAAQTDTERSKYTRNTYMSRQDLERKLHHLQVENKVLKSKLTNKSKELKDARDTVKNLEQTVRRLWTTTN